MAGRQKKLTQLNISFPSNNGGSSAIINSLIDDTLCLLCVDEFSRFILSIKAIEINLKREFNSLRNIFVDPKESRQMDRKNR